MKLRTLLLASISIAGLISPVVAADNLPPLITKAATTAAVPYNCTTTGCNGWSVGLEMSGNGTGVNVLNLGEFNAGGTYIGVNGGYQFYNGTWWLGAKVKLDYEVYDPTGLATGLTNKIFAFEGAELGGNATQLFSGITPITLSGPLATAVPTVLVGACQHGSQSGYCIGAGAHFFVPNTNWTIDVDYLNGQYSPVSTNGIVSGGSVDNRGSFGFSYHFGNL